MEGEVPKVEVPEVEVEAEAPKVEGELHLPKVPQSCVT